MTDQDIIQGLRKFGLSPHKLGELAGIASGHLYLVAKGIKRLGRQSIEKILQADEIDKKYPGARDWFKQVIHS